MMSVRRLVVAVLLAVWTFPAVSQARPEPASPPPLPALVTGPAATESSAPSPPSGEAATLASREKQTADLPDFRGGGVVIYLGSGVLLVLVIILLILVL